MPLPLFLAMEHSCSEMRTVSSLLQRRQTRMWVL